MLGDVGAPTLVVHASESFVRRDVTERMAATLPRGRHASVGPSTHVVPVDAPGPLTDLLVDFLRDES